MYLEKGIDERYSLESLAKPSCKSQTLAHFHSRSDHFESAFIHAAKPLNALEKAF
jgi:hypothetical protein